MLAVAIAPDGTWLATGDDGTVRIWDATDGQHRTTLTGHKSLVLAVAIAPDGTWLATGSHDGTVRIWDTATGQHRTTRTGTKSPVHAVAISPDGTWLATAGDDRTVRIWDPTAPDAVAVMRLDQPAAACAWMPDSTGLTVGGSGGLYLFAFNPGPAAGKKSLTPSVVDH